MQFLHLLGINIGRALGHQLNDNDKEAIGLILISMMQKDEYLKK